ncbi:MAG: response regulator transcription factor [Deltaproteobacteria bacterium]|nr:response regulator transcription factor [Deltaproteobacteria bacterium]MBN2671055.1 response regulator transcription factor [Deltaproteobacteria bacterium]
MNAIVVDDEMLARQYLQEMLKAHENVTVVAECKNGFEAVKAVAEHNPDLIFLDIQMPKLDGFEVLELIDRDDIAVVFATAYDQYALKAFDSHAVDYLLKPFSAERLAKAIEKVSANRGRPLPQLNEMKATDTKPEALTRIVVKDGSKIEMIPVTDVDYISAEDDYVDIHYAGKSILKHQTLAGLEKMLDADKFIRIHRSSIVNIERVDRIELLAKDKYIAILKDRTELRISRSGHKRLKEVIG